MTAMIVDDGIIIKLTPEQHRYVLTSIHRMSRADKRGAEKIERKYQQPVRDESLLKRLTLADECLSALTVSPKNVTKPSPVSS